MVNFRFIFEAALLFVFFLSPLARAGDIIKFSCGKCAYSVVLHLGSGLKDPEPFAPFVCTSAGKKTLVGIKRASSASGPVKSTKCEGLALPLTFKPGMACPVCDGDTLKSEWLGTWD